MADGKTCDTVESVIISVTTDAGITGWGEVCPIPHYLPAYARGVAPALNELAPIILGADPIGPEAVMARAQDWLQGHVYAKSALDIALWDITGQAADLPLYALLGGGVAKTCRFIIPSLALPPQIWRGSQPMRRAKGSLSSK